MINIIALTRFAFLTLGIVFLKIMIQANSDYQVSRYLQPLNSIALCFLRSQSSGLLLHFFVRASTERHLYPRVAYGVGIIIAGPLAPIGSSATRTHSKYICAIGRE